MDNDDGGGRGGSGVAATPLRRHRGDDADDPRRPDSVTPYARPECKPAASLYALLAIAFGTAATLTRGRVWAWLSALFALGMLANANTRTTDMKQMLASLAFSTMVVVTSYVSPSARSAAAPAA